MIDLSPREFEMFETSRPPPHDPHATSDVWSMQARLFVIHTEAARLVPAVNDTVAFVDLAEHVAVDAELDHAF